MVQWKRAQEIRQEWIAKGSPACKHTDLDKEYYLGAQSGDYICMTCGEPFGSKEEARRDAATNDPDQDG